MSQRVQTAILISGGGSNMEALIRAAEAPDYPAKIGLVISNNPNAGGLTKAKAYGVKTLTISHKAYKTRELFEREMDSALRAHYIQLVCNAGFMRILTPWFVRRWLGRQLNIHPSLLPKHKGLHTHQRALDAGDKQHGCTVHWVSEGMDEGEIIAQSKVDIRKADTAEGLAVRVLKEEHILYSQVLGRVATSI